MINDRFFTARIFSDQLFGERSPVDETTNSSGELPKGVVGVTTSQIGVDKDGIFDGINSSGAQD